MTEMITMGDDNPISRSDRETAGRHMRDGSRRLDTGYSVAEIIERSRKWWGEYRGAIAPAFNLISAAPRVMAPGRRAPGFIIRDAPRFDLRNGILSGLSWESLTPDEQFRVVKTWHHMNVRERMRPDYEYRRELLKAYRGRHGNRTGLHKTFDKKAGTWNSPHGINLGRIIT